jgi:hypothetical protein
MMMECDTNMGYAFKVVPERALGSNNVARLRMMDVVAYSRQEADRPLPGCQDTCARMPKGHNPRGLCRGHHARCRLVNNIR